MVLIVFLSSCSNSSSNSTSSISTTSKPTNTSPITWSIQGEYNLGGRAQNVFSGLSCYNSENCQAAGGSKTTNYLLGTSDGGSTWSREPVPTFLTKALSGGGSVGNLGDISCPSASTCYGITQHNYNVTFGTVTSSGLGAAIISTDDSGSTWKLVTTIPNTLFFNSISCSSVAICVAVGESSSSTQDSAGFIAYTTNGVTWTRANVASTTPELNGVSCPTSTHCVATGSDLSSNKSTVLVSNDGGKIWIRSSLPGDFNSLQTLSCPSELVCFALGSSSSSSNSGNSGTTGPSVVVKSVDGGKSWTKGTPLDASDSPMSISCVSSSECFMVGYSSQGTGASPLILETQNAGTTWSTIKVPGSVSVLMRVSCVPTGSCWAIGGKSPSNSSSLIGTFTTGYILYSKGN
ncbi:MAG: hypothetical protein HKL80_01945 [Acidimicrobiales bacterium]|nr:hypothetical protein [Acidimicrobiales bacterium]